MVICRKKQPVLEAVFSAETEKEINLRAVVAGHPRHVATDIPGRSGHEMPALL
jgi:hypothetical protein